MNLPLPTNASVSEVGANPPGYVLAASLLRFLIESAGVSDLFETTEVRNAALQLEPVRKLVMLMKADDSIYEACPSRSGG